MKAQIVALFVLVAACNGSDSDVCELGETQECVCAGGAKGVQICNENRNGWQECEGCPTPGIDGGTTPDAAAIADASPADQASTDIEEGSDQGLPDATTPDVTSPDAAVSVPGTWIPISAGTFPMGSPVTENCRTYNEYQHPVTLSNGFEIQSTEVTQEQFSSLMGYNPSYYASCGDDCPAESLSWHESVAYCNALSELVGHAKCYTCTGSGSTVVCSEAATYSGEDIYSCPGYRLPTEAEWEYAYRAGTTTALYNGDIISCDATDANASAIGWYDYNSSNKTHPVGEKTPNAWGLYDMAGNVWEWCHDWFTSSLGTTPVQDPWGGASGTARIYRGGAAGFSAAHFRGASRFGGNPTTSLHANGFRCARTR